MTDGGQKVGEKFYRQLKDVSLAPVVILQSKSIWRWSRPFIFFFVQSQKSPSPHRHEFTFKLPLDVLRAAIYILSVYLSFLCCMPCFSDGCADEERTICSVDSAQEDNDCGHDNACTPFCFDRCCGTSFFCEPALPSIAAPCTFTNDKRFSYSEALIPQPLNSIWQPPRLTIGA